MTNYQSFKLAQYTPSANPRYAGNPFIEAMGELPDDKTLARKLTCLPGINPELHKLPAHQRIDLLSDVHSICVPLPRLVNLARNVLKLMREGYGPRRPQSVSDNKIVRELFRPQQDGLPNWVIPQPQRSDLARQMSMSLIGSSGSGKSFGLSKITGLLDSTIYHEEFGKWQLPFIFIEMSYDGESVHTLSSELFRELDRLLPDAGYTDLYLDRKGLNAQQRLAKALALCYEHGVGTILVDESQNQRGIGNDADSRKRSKQVKSETPLMKLLITASNISHIPLLMSGTPELSGVVGGRFTRQRRMCGNGSAQWRPLERSQDPTQSCEFDMMMRTLWRYQYVQKPIVGNLTPEWADHFFSLSQGIPDILVKLWASVQSTAITCGQEAISHELVDAVFREEFATVAMPLKAMRENNQTVLAGLTDLYSPESLEARPAAKAKAVKKSYPVPTATPVTVKQGSGADIRSMDGVAAPALQISRWTESLMT